MLYDDNGISIDGATNITFTEDVPKRYKAYGWHTHTVMNGNDVSSCRAPSRPPRPCPTSPAS